MILISMFGPVDATSLVDSIQYGHVQSEKAHVLQAELGEIITGQNGLTARKLLPPENDGWRGGRMSFQVKVDPEKPNYITTKFWGSDVNSEQSRLMLFINGKQVGQRHLGEVDPLDIMYVYPRNAGNFFYKTLPLPQHMTKGKQTVVLTIEAQGPIWAYGQSFEIYQKPMKDASRGIYASYIHTDPFLKFNFNNNKTPWKELKTTDGPGIEVLDEVKEKINKYIENELSGKDKLALGAIHFLARAFWVDWSTAYHNPKVIDKVVKAINLHYAEFKSKPEIVGKTWEGYGAIGESVSFLSEPLKPYLNKTLEGTGRSYKEAWTEMLVTSRDWHVQNRRSYTNQSMIVDKYTYRCNRGIAVLQPEKAWSEETALRLMYESIGLEPWSGSWDESLKPSWSHGKNFMQLSTKGLTKELGYVGAYGEVQDVILGMYDSSRPNPNAPGDERLKEQVAKIARARTIFRYPLATANGERVMHLETVIGWRDTYYPGDIAYGQRPARDGGPLDIAAATLDPDMLAYAQQIINDNWYFKTLRTRLEGNRYSELLSQMLAPQSYTTVMAQKTKSKLLPMTPGQPDFVFADPELGALALKNGDQILYVSLYWRARYAINNLARVHLLSPYFEYDATVHMQTEFNNSGLVYTMPDYTNAPYSAWVEKGYKAEGMHLAVAGQQQAIAKVPEDQKGWKPGKENIYAGKGNFYTLLYGSYFIAMNCTGDKSYTLAIPEKFLGGKNLVEGNNVEKNQVRVKPMQTVVLFAGD